MDYLCLECGTQYIEKVKICEICGSTLILMDEKPNYNWIGHRYDPFYSNKDHSKKILSEEEEKEKYDTKEYEIFKMFKKVS